ncbi:MAG: hypothetical protein A2622_13730 [Bdellovibrionales bacterium RIFCSPHIGHO2_01_FULL_40_29]|nr:MAG: hypothetical protein A2622_13730 [Bdellovibrionales bacterium RIFCSPHIGHO2_01_FULL_40_29]OFZ35211.1 MAG: hypothetical protein A3D17_14380 [Bdellovibrionales bacterium RIFCSPHIGHO2_02_FULL_40_15]
MAKIFLSHESSKIQKLFRDWYGTLSVLELAVNSKMTRKIQEIENQLELLKQVQRIDEQTKLNLRQLETDLSFLWELLTPTEKSRNLVFNKFLELQKEVRVTCDRNLTNKGI